MIALTFAFGLVVSKTLTQTLRRNISLRCTNALMAFQIEVRTLLPL